MERVAVRRGTCEATVEGSRLVIATAAEVDQAEFRGILRRYGVMGRTDYEIIEGLNGGEIFVIDLL